MREEGIDMRIAEMRVQWLHNPIGLQELNPVLSYMLKPENSLKAEEENIHTCQSRYRILVSSKKELLYEDTGDLWDSGIVEKQETFGIVYKGRKLSSREKAYWKVKVWDNEGHASQWSDISSWEMGLFNEDWNAKWIGQGDDYDGSKSAAPMFVCDFMTNISNIKHARLYISGLGIFQAYLNGEKITENLFEPGECDATKTIYYVTYDVSEMLRNGDNALGVILGNGQYTNFQFNPVMTKPDGTLHPLHRYQKNDGGFVKPGISGNKKLIAQLEITYKNGERVTAAASGEGWRWTEGPVVFQNWYGGEDYDATREIPDWNIPGGLRNDWKPAVIMEAPKGRLMSREFLPIKIMERIPAKSVRRLKNGNLLVDMGRNGAGFPEISLKTNPDMKGIWIKMYPAELLKEDKEGVNQASCTQSWSERFQCAIVDSYRVKGTGNETWHPSFCYQGFQYIEVEGWQGELTTENFKYCIVRTSNDKSGYIRTSNERLNRINEMVEHSMESNMFGAFTDCPQIEKLGWIETSHLMFRSLAGTYDISSWMRKIIHDITDSQLDKEQAEYENNEPEGYVPAIIPEYQRIVGLHRDPNWNGACIFTPWEYYMYYGDITILEKSYPTMKKYLKYLQGYIKDGVLEDYAQMGEWGELNGNTPAVLVATCAYYRMLKIMESVARMLEDETEALAMKDMAELTRNAFHNNPKCYNSQTKSYGSGSQSSYGYVLSVGLVPDERISETVEKLVEVIRNNDYHLSSGEVGLKQVFLALAENGRNDVVYKMIMNKTAPSYGFFADMGLTTLPEYWNCDELWNGMVRSFNHAMMGHVKEWLTFYMLGVKPVEPGFSKVKISPYMPEDIDRLEGEVSTPYGNIYVLCERADKEVKVKTIAPYGICVIE